MDSKRDLLKEWRIWVLALSLIVSTALLVPWNNSTLFFDTSGDEVGFQTNLENRTSIEFSGGTRLLLDMNLTDVERESEIVADEVRNTLDVRLENTNLPDTSVRTVDIGGSNYRIQIESGTSDQKRLREVVQREGSFETRMPIPLAERNNYEKNFTLGDYKYNFKYENRNVSVKGFDNNFSTVVGEGQRFEVTDNGIDNFNTSFVFNGFNESDSIADIEAVMYTGEQIQSVVESDSQITGGGQSYGFRFPVVISNDAAENRLHISQNYGSRTDPSSRRSFLVLDNGEFLRSGLYVDGERESGLRMGSVFADSAETRSTISGGGESREEAVDSMNRLISILKSGSLPVPVDVVSSTTLTAERGGKLMTASIASIIASLVAVGLAVFARYKDPRVVLPIVFTGASEVYILLGAYFTTIGTLSLSAVAGIIAAVGTGVDDQIIITDESGREELQGWKQKMKNAFFVIFTSAASTIGAMTPIIAPSAISYLIGLSGIGLMGYTLYTRGRNRHYIAIGAFAILVSAFTTTLGPSGAALSTIHEFARTTILGILVGITITRPAFAKFIEFIKE